MLFKSAGQRPITIALTHRAVALLRHKRSIGLSAKGSFTATGSKPVTAIKRLMLTVTEAGGSASGATTLSLPDSSRHRALYGAGVDGRYWARTHTQS